LPLNKVTMNLNDIQPSDCLLIIDVQRDFCKDGALAVPDGDAVVPIINDLSHAFDTVVLTQDWHPSRHSSFASEHDGKQPLDTVEFPYGPQTLWPDHCVQGSSGAAFHPELNTDTAQMIVRKGFRQAIDSYSAFYENDKSTSTGLSAYLRDRAVKRVFCTGLATDFCVRFSAEDAVREKFETFVVSNACRGIDFNGSVAEANKSMASIGVTLVSSFQ